MSKDVIVLVELPTLYAKELYKEYDRLCDIAKKHSLHPKKHHDSLFGGIIPYLDVRGVDSVEILDPNKSIWHSFIGRAGVTKRDVMVFRRDWGDKAKVPYYIGINSEYLDIAKKILEELNPDYLSLLEKKLEKNR